MTSLKRLFPRRYVIEMTLWRNTGGTFERVGCYRRFFRTRLFATMALNSERQHEGEAIVNGWRTRAFRMFALRRIA